MPGMNQVWYCGNCRSLNDVRNKVCYACHTKRSDAEALSEDALRAIADGRLVHFMGHDRAALGGTRSRSQFWTCG